MTGAAFIYQVGVRLLGAFSSIFFLGLIILGAYLNLRDLSAIALTLIAGAYGELSRSTLVGIQVATTIAALLLWIYLLRRCTRWFRRYVNIGEKTVFDPQTRFATTYASDQVNIDFGFAIIEVGLALVLAAIVVYSFWDSFSALVCSFLGGGLAVAGVVLLISAAKRRAPSYTYYPGTPEFNLLAADFVMGTEDRDQLAKKLAEIPPDNVDYPMAQRMLDSIESGTDLGVGQFGFGLPPGSPTPPPPEEQPERIG